MPQTRRLLLIGAAAAVLMPFGPAPLRADPDGVALMGYDAVAYFRDDRAEPGAGHIALRWRGLIWHFATVENRAAFEADPRAYAPQFGGLCPLALQRGEIMAGDPRNWTIRDGKLYLSSSPEGLERLRAELPTVLPLAAQHFRALQGR
jgi:hypothetical protein